MRKLFLSIGVCLIVSMSGCAAAGSGSCGTSDFSLFQSSAPRNQPFRDCIRNWFRGDECNTCNAPAGLPTTCDSNVSPLCNQHGTQFSQAQPIYSSAPVQQPIGQGVQLYSDPNLNIGIPTAATPDLSSNLIDPAFGEGNLGIPDMAQFHPLQPTPYMVEFQVRFHRSLQSSPVMASCRSGRASNPN